MKKSYLLVLFMLVSVYAMAQQNMYVFSKNGGFNYFTCEEVDSVVFVCSPQVEEALSNAILGEVQEKTTLFLNKNNTVYSNPHNDCGVGGIALFSDLNGPDMFAPNNGYNWFTSNTTYNDRTANTYPAAIRWKFYYKAIDACNKELRMIGKDRTNALLNFEIAQLKTMRAYCYLSLAPYYQFSYATSKDKPCVPIYTEDIRDLAPRATVQDVYDQIVKDLTESLDYLNASPTDNPYYIDVEVAQALLARTYFIYGKLG